MSVGEVVKWALVAVIALVLWRWVRTGISANIGPGQTYQVQQPGGGFASGFIPFSGGKRGGFTFGLNIPVGYDPFVPGPNPAY